MHKRMEIGAKLADIVAQSLGLSADKIYCSTRKKNNGTEHMILCIRTREPEKDGLALEPIFYIDEMVDRILAGKMTLEESAAIVKEEFSAHGEEKADEKMFSKDFILKNCTVKVVSAEMNAEELENQVHRQMCDLAEVVVVTVHVGGKEGLMTMEKWMLEAIGIDEQELFEAAHKNTAADARLQELGEALGDESPNNMLYLLTNSANVYGAALVACPEVLKACREVIGEDVYVIPSSVHDVILCKKEGGDEVAGLKDIIKLVNNAEFMNPEDVLSSHLYGFDEKGELYIVR